MSALPPASEKAAAVREMFDRIASRYGRVNRLMTLSADNRWRQGLVKRLGIGPGNHVLDLACGTGDFARICQARGAGVIALDFAHSMLEVAAARPGLAGVLVQGDALRLPFADASFDGVVSGFSLRNFTEIAPALCETARVLRPGGRLGLLEVDRPRNRVAATGHALYFNRIVPFVGGLISDRDAYRYLPESVAYLPTDSELARLLHNAGFTHLRKRRHLLGAAQSITATRK